MHGGHEGAEDRILSNFSSLRISSKAGHCHQRCSGVSKTHPPQCAQQNFASGFLASFRPGKLAEVGAEVEEEEEYDDVRTDDEVVSLSSVEETSLEEADSEPESGSADPESVTFLRPHRFAKKRPPEVTARSASFRARSVVVRRSALVDWQSTPCSIP